MLLTYRQAILAADVLSDKVLAGDAVLLHQMCHERRDSTQQDACKLRILKEYCAGNVPHKHSSNPCSWLLGCRASLGSVRALTMAEGTLQSLQHTEGQRRNHCGGSRGISERRFTEHSIALTNRNVGEAIEQACRPRLVMVVCHSVSVLPL